MADGHRFAVVRHKLSGGEARGTLVVGSTALTFLNKEDKIVFVHPYRVIQRYCVNERKQFQYAFEMTGSKTLIYAFDTDEAAAIVAHIDRNSLRLEKTFADADKGGTVRTRPFGHLLLLTTRGRGPAPGLRHRLRFLCRSLMLWARPRLHPRLPPRLAARRKWAAWKAFASTSKW